MRRSDLIPKGSKLNDHWEERLEDLLVGGGVQLGLVIAGGMILYAVVRWVVS
jgi:hypothetical protein